MDVRCLRLMEGLNFMLSVGVGGQISGKIQTGGVGGGEEGVLGQRAEGSHGVSGDRGTQFGWWSSATTG